jgi:hypothetical protein
MICMHGRSIVQCKQVVWAIYIYRHIVFLWETSNFDDRPNQSNRTD